MPEYLFFKKKDCGTGVGIFLKVVFLALLKLVISFKMSSRKKHFQIETCQKE